MANSCDHSSTSDTSSKRHKPEEEVNNNNEIHNKNNNQINKSSDEEIFKFSDTPTMEEIRVMHAKFCRDRDWDQFHSPRNVLLALIAEMGELSELFQWKNECEVGLKDWTLKERKSLEEELSDCLIYLLRLSDRCGVDLPKAVVKKLAKNDAKYPVDKVFGSSKKYTEYQ